MVRPEGYTPSTDVVRAEYWENGSHRYGSARGDEFEAEFDRWLAAHEAEVRERIAQDIEAQRIAPYMGSFLADDDNGWNRAVEQAARIARGATR